VTTRPRNAAAQAFDDLELRTVQVKRVIHPGGVYDFPQLDGADAGGRFDTVHVEAAAVVRPWRRPVCSDWRLLAASCTREVRFRAKWPMDVEGRLWPRV
jgi:hypothetical protein